MCSPIVHSPPPRTPTNEPRRNRTSYPESHRESNRCPRISRTSPAVTPTGQTQSTEIWYLLDDEEGEDDLQRRIAGRYRPEVGSSRHLSSWIAEPVRTMEVRETADEPRSTNGLSAAEKIGVKYDDDVTSHECRNGALRDTIEPETVKKLGGTTWLKTG